MWDPATNPNAGSKIANFSSSAMVVRDMVEFVERHGEWREKQAIDSLQKVALKWNKGEEPVSLFGASYGTVLGALLAAMQPNRVNRLLLDGVVDSEAWFKGNPTVSSLTADDPVHKFSEYCALAGPENCSMWAGNSSRDTERRWENIVLDLEKNGPRPDPINPGKTIDASNVRAMMARLNSRPLLKWPAVAEVLSRLPTGNAPLGTNESFAGKGDGGRNSTQGTRIPLDADMSNDNVDVQASRGMTYFNWPIQFGWRFGDKHAVASNVTANPILFSSNLVDGVTGLPAAQTMQSRFKGSGLLITDGEGHTGRAESSLCYAKTVRRYFQKGELPDTSKHCLPLRRPFMGKKGPNVEVIDRTTWTKEDKMLFRAIDAPCPWESYCD
ncbi:hypothetical protein CB0940_08625 [Cercospora beticola]|uniref:Peptidase S33 tripeptidyl aminopeptidase-like C-terminal domain-containing protein n=1 Tax=Cercospora beticola TaxID=122368 RepID=A0A2G5HQD5_CERBT|nr:hypothetical protein CB0940_08625 [Cercospora beticola]PIA94740.1 hypothetical protein CB0940_08625 [Cercospora beticola]